MDIDMRTEDDRSRAEQLRSVLSELRFPAPRWRILAEASHRGLSPLQCHQLGVELPERVFAHLSEVVATVVRSSPPSTEQELLSSLRAVRGTHRSR